MGEQVHNTQGQVLGVSVCGYDRCSDERYRSGYEPSHNAYVFLDTLRDCVRGICALLLRLRAGGSSDLPTTIKSGM